MIVILRSNDKMVQMVQTIPEKEKFDMDSPLASRSCSTIYKSFCDRRLVFQIIHGSGTPSNSRLLLVLDSSFNPPHLAHENLVNRAIRYYKNRPLHVLLLLSVNNADKFPKPASFDKRMEMMCLMADILQKENISTSVGITTCAKFADKDEIMRRNLCYDGLISYLVGFDTIIRIFNPKYYVPKSVPEALKEFMVSTNFFCLTRDSDHKLDEQIKYRTNIIKGLYEPTIPRDWGRKIQLEPNDEKYASISSSGIRNAVLNNCREEDLKLQLPPPILTYIRKKGKALFNK